MQRVIMLILVAIQLVGCDNSSSTSSNSPTSTPATNSSVTDVNGPPTISGTPVASVVVGSAYNFTPAAPDPNGNALSFSIQNKPSWASFNSQTGQLSGTPTSADVGSYSNVSISVSDGVLSATLPSFSISVTQFATGSATLSWLPPTTNTDGATLTNLAGYHIHYGTNPASLADRVTIANPGISTYVIGNLPPGKWYFSVTAFNTSRVESHFSNVASKTI
jgi:hypothetical protein